MPSLNTLRHLACAVLLLASLHVSAEPATLRSVTNSSTTTGTVVRLEFSKVIKTLPSDFLLGSPASLVVDFDDVKNITPRTVQIGSSLVETLKIGSSQAKTRLVFRLSRKVDYSVTLEGTSVAIAFRIPDEPAAKAQAIVQPVISFSLGDDPLADARTAISTGNYQTAIEKLNSVLLGPSGAVTQEAQELIGSVFEKMKQPEKAKAEYRAYMAMYPDSDATPRIRMRLLALEITAPPTANVERQRTIKEGSSKDVSGSVAGYYYAGAAPATGLQWSTDQSIFISNYSLTGLFRENQYMLKLSGKYSEFQNLLSSKSNKSTLPILQAQFDDSYLGYGVKLGRQNASLGVLGRYDGISAYYSFTPDYRLSFSAGVPYMGRLPTSRNFVTIGMDASFTQAFNMSVYLNRQLADGIPERNALGIEARYFNDGSSLTGIVEYDTLYRAINTTMVQGTLTAGTWTLYGLLDRRKSPALFAERALVIGQDQGRSMYTTVGEVFGTSGYSRETIYDYITATSPVSTAYVVSLSKAISARWTASVNVQGSNFYTPYNQSIIPTVEPIQAVVAPRNVYSIGAQLIGNDILSKGNAMHFLGSTSRSPELNMWYVAALDSFSWGKAKIDFTLRADRQSRLLSILTDKSLSARINYKFDGGISLEAQYSINRAVTVDELMMLISALNSQTIYFGIRYEF